MLRVENGGVSQVPLEPQPQIIGQILMVPGPNGSRELAVQMAVPPAEAIAILSIVRRMVEDQWTQQLQKPQIAVVQGNVPRTP